MLYVMQPEGDDIVDLVGPFEDSRTMEEWMNKHYGTGWEEIVWVINPASARAPESGTPSGQWRRMMGYEETDEE